MTETLQNTIAELLDKFGIAFDGTKTWTVDTFMPYIKELVEKMRTCQIISDSVGIVICCIIFIIFTFYFIQVNKNYKQIVKTEKSNFFFELELGDICPTTSNVIASTISAFIVFITFIVLLVDLKELLKWIFIPDVQFIEYISDLIST